MKIALKTLYVLLFFLNTNYSQQTELFYLSGKDAGSPVEWEFIVSKGRNANQWSTIPVPSNWELHEFGEYNYGHDKNKSDEIGFYKYKFDLDSTWIEKKIFIVFEGVMTDTEVKINNNLAGPIHQGGFYRFKYDITNFVTFDEENLLEVKVKKVSDNHSVEIAERKSDYWVFGGIFRPVYLKVVPKEHIIRTAIDAKADGTFRIDVYYNAIKKADKIEIQIVQPNGKPLGNKQSIDIKKNNNFVSIFSKVNGQKNWTSETPNLYYRRYFTKVG